MCALESRPLEGKLVLGKLHSNTDCVLNSWSIVTACYNEMYARLNLNSMIQHFIITQPRTVWR